MLAAARELGAICVLSRTLLPNSNSSFRSRPPSITHSAPQSPNSPRSTAAGLSVHLVADARAALFHARASVVASGTATVEAALIGNPFVVVYRVSPVTYAIAKRAVKVPHVAMANLIAGKRVVPELIQHDFTAANIVQQLKRLLPDGPARESMKVELGVIRDALRTSAGRQCGVRPGAIERVAESVSEELEAAYSGGTWPLRNTEVNLRISLNTSNSAHERRQE